MATINSWGSEDPAEETKGGTGTSTYTAGDILYSDATNSLEKLAKGTDGEVLTLASGLPSWATASGGSGIVYLATATASDSSSLDFSSSIDSTYNLYLFVIDQLVPASGSLLYIRTSANGGSSYDAGASDYRYKSTDGSLNSKSFGASNIRIASQIDNGANNGLSGKAYLYNPSDANYTHINFEDSFVDTSEVEIRYGFGTRKSAAAVDGLQFIMDSGNITSGTIKMYGMTTPS